MHAPRMDLPMGQRSGAGTGLNPGDPHWDQRGSSQINPLPDSFFALYSWYDARRLDSILPRRSPTCLSIRRPTSHSVGTADEGRWPMRVRTCTLRLSTSGHPGSSTSVAYAQKPCNRPAPAPLAHGSRLARPVVTASCQASSNNLAQESWASCRYPGLFVTLTAPYDRAQNAA